MRPKAWWHHLETWQQLGGIIGTLTAVLGLLLALGVIEPVDPNPVDSDPSTMPSGEIARFDGVAGHLAESRALLDFLDQHDDDTVYLEVGFPALGTGPGGGDNVSVENVPVDGGTKALVTSITLMTECPAVSLSKNPTVADGCQGTSLSISGAPTDDSGTFFEHGVPVIKGHFLVDITGGLHMGVTPVHLRPLTFEQATGG